MKKMKLYKYVGLSALCLSLNSCADFIDNAPDDILTLEMVFDDKTRMEDWLAGVYQQIRDPRWSGLRNDAFEMLANDMNPSQGWLPYWGAGSGLGYRVGQWEPNTSWDGSYWTMQQQVRQAYIFMDNVKPLPKQNVTEADVETMKVECRFMIAYYYWMMTYAYGAVPYFEDDMPSTSTDLMRGQATFTEMMDFLDKEFAECAELLPESWTALYGGRATKLAALAMRARILLFAASPLVNGNPWYAGHVNNDGEEIFPSTYDASKWKKAADAFKTLIDEAKAEGKELYIEKNADDTVDGFMSCYGSTIRTIGEGNNEIIWWRPNWSRGDWEQHSTPRGCGGNGGLGVTQSLVDAFFMEDGTEPILGYNTDGSPILNPDCDLYSEKGFSTEPEYRETDYYLMDGYKSDDYPADVIAPDGKRLIVQPNTFNMYCHREPRFYLTVVWNGQWFKWENRNTNFLYNGPDGGPTHDAPQNGYLNRRGVHLDYIPRDNNHPYTCSPIFRLAEAYLGYAEALNECDDRASHTEEILTYLNKIRNRAGIAEYGTGTDANGFQRIPLDMNDQDEVRRLIHKERRVEFVAESMRLYDLRRWKTAHYGINNPNTDGGNPDPDWGCATPDFGMNYYGTEYTDQGDNAFFKRTQEKARVFPTKYYWYPIHQSQIDKDPTLVQAPFWVDNSSAE